MARPKAVTSISMTGPFFTRDPRKTFRENVRVMLAAVAEEGARDIVTQLRSGEATRKPLYGQGSIAFDYRTGKKRVRGVGPRDPFVRGHRVSEFVEGYATGIRTGRKWEMTSRIHIRNKGLREQGGISLHAAAASLERRFHPFRKTTNRLHRAKSVNQAELLKGLQ